MLPTQNLEESYLFLAGVAGKSEYGVGIPLPSFVKARMPSILAKYLGIVTKFWYRNIFSHYFKPVDKGLYRHSSGEGRYL